MELFDKLFSSLLVFVYHCFDRIVINGYLSGLSRPEQLVHFFREVMGVPAITREVLSRRTDDYRRWIEQELNRTAIRFHKRDNAFLSVSDPEALQSAADRLANPPSRAGYLSAPPDRCGLDQLRYDLRKMKAPGLVERDGRRYAYWLTEKGVQVALLFLFFHKRLCDPLAHGRFHHQPNAGHRPTSKLETAYHRADEAIQQIVDLPQAA